MNRNKIIDILRVFLKRENLETNKNVKIDHEVAGSIPVASTIKRIFLQTP